MIICIKKMDFAALRKNCCPRIRVRGWGDFILYFVFFRLGPPGVSTKKKDWRIPTAGGGGTRTLFSTATFRPFVCSCLDSALAFTPCLSEARALHSTLLPPTHGRLTSLHPTQLLLVVPFTSSSQRQPFFSAAPRVDADTVTRLTTSQRLRSASRVLHGWSLTRLSSHQSAPAAT